MSAVGLASPVFNDPSVDGTARTADHRPYVRRSTEPRHEEALRRCADRLVAVARRLLRNEEDARDAVQDALLSAFRSSGRFEQRAQLSTWLHRIVVNAALMQLRARRRRPEDRIADLPTGRSNGAEHVSPSSDALEPPDAILERRERCALVRQCIQSLPEIYRTVLLLRDIEELDTSETARRLGVSPIVVRCRLHRAHRALRRLLAPHFCPDAA